MEGLEFRRHRRVRSSPAIRGLVRETELTPAHLVAPLFVEQGLDGRAPIEAMPGQSRLGLEALVEEARKLQSAGVPAVLLFGIPATKDERGSPGYDDEGIVQQATRRLKDALPEMLVVGDVCLCEYTSHGHCGLLSDDGDVDNDASLPLLADMAVSLADAGCDIVAPERHDGRPRGRHPRGAGRLGSGRHRHPLLRGQVRERLLRPRSGRRQTARQPSATGGATRWTRRTPAWRATRF